MTRARVILVVAVVVVLGATLTGAVILRSYDQATHIDRGVAKVVVRQYIDAALVEQDERRSSLFTCGKPGDLSVVADLRRDLEGGEARNGFATQLAISRSMESGGGSAVEIELQLNQGMGTDVRTRIVYLRFHMVNEDGWRVCSAEQVPDPTPTATPPTTG